MCSPCPASSGSFKKPCQSLLRAHAPLARDEFILHSPTSRGEFDAWARIRTWEPLREGILSPSPLTRLGYPRAARETSGAVKPFLVRRPRARGLQVRRELRRLDPAWERGEGFPEPRYGWQDSVPRFHAEDHGLDGSPQPHHRGRAGCPEGFLTERPKRVTPTAMDAISRM